MWKCNKCGRELTRENQAHSCKTVPLEKHFKDKEEAKLLYEYFKKKVKEKVGDFVVRPLDCCIHFDTSTTFLAVFALKNGIRLHLTLTHELKNPRIKDVGQYSANRYKHRIEIFDRKEVDKELLEWISEANQLLKKVKK